MKEFDFEELDRAVNSLMKDAPGSSPVKSDDDVRTVTLPDTTMTDSQLSQQISPMSTQSEASSDTEPALSEIPAESGDATNDAPTVDPELINRPAEDTGASEGDQSVTEDNPEVSKDTPSKRSVSMVPHRNGRFMDVKHDSSMMRAGSGSTSNSPVSAPSERATRIARTVEPTTSTQNAVLESSSAPLVDVVTPVMKDDQTTDTLESNDDVIAKSTANELTPQGEKSHESDQSPAEYSAFLPDAKVEKRPLGQLQSQATDSTADTVSAPSIPLQTNDNQDLGNPPSTETPLSAEYDQHLMSIESGNTSGSEPQSVKPEKSQEPVEAASSGNDSEPALTNGPTSIQQQYKESPSSGDQTNGAIYDTASYHQPLKHPAKKKPGWLWVILIVIIILLGAGGGAWIYFNGM